MAIRNRYTVPGILAEARLRTGRPLAEAEWIAAHEAAAGRPLAPRKPGRKKAMADEK